MRGAAVREEVKRDLNESGYDFVHTVWPAVSGYYEGGELYPVETARESGFISKLDTCSGIDAFQFLESRHMLRGIASRVQYGSRYYPTFTLRYRRSNGAVTEFEKRLHAIQHVEQGYIYPHLTIQAYMSRPSGKLLAVAATETKSLYLYAQKYREVRSRVYQQRNRSDGNSFLVVLWEPYRQEGHPLMALVSHETHDEIRM